MNAHQLEAYARPDKEGMEMLRDWMVRLDMSARAYDRILKVARTIADLDYAASVDFSSKDSISQAIFAPVTAAHIAEAVGYRNLDRASWAKSY